MRHSSPSERAFTVTQLNQRARQLLEISFSQVRVEGEISNLSRPSSGHWYFTLKDSGAQVRCAMFRARTAQLRFMPKEGDFVEVTGKVSLYENRGDYQLIIDHMKPAGEGALLLAFQQLKAQLAHQGLFDPTHKKPLPIVKRVGIVTSATGAALHDMLTVLARRSPAIEVDIYPAAVQGRDAIPQIIHAIERANRDQRVDVLIVGRGGGSLEDLWCFNDEQVARAIFASTIPIVSAVGHETDVTIADFVADVRAPTPSAAAELISPDQQIQVQRVQQQYTRLRAAIQRTLQDHQQRLRQWQSRCRTPKHVLTAHSQQLDQLEMRLQRAWQVQWQRGATQLQQQQRALQQQHPQRLLRLQQERLSSLQPRLQLAMKQHQQRLQQGLSSRVAMLHSLSPLNVLARGYSITQSADGSVIQRIAQVEPGMRLRSRVQDGWIESNVSLLQPEESS